MTTKSKEQFIGPKLTKAQRVEALKFYTQLSAPRMEEINNVLTQDQYSDTKEILSVIDITNNQIEELMAILKSRRTTSHKSGPNTGVGARCRALIAERLGNKEVLAKIKEEFPMNNTTYSCVAWYRNDMKQKGEL